MPIQLYRALKLLNGSSNMGHICVALKALGLLSVALTEPVVLYTTYYTQQDVTNKSDMSDCCLIRAQPAR
jgi:hypothetical protein